MPQDGGAHSRMFLEACHDDARGSARLAAQPGIVITLRVKNIDTAAHDFRAVLYGAVLE